MTSEERSNVIYSLPEGGGVGWGVRAVGGGLEEEQPLD